MKEISCFVDESGSDNLRDRYYLVALVLHDQSESLTAEIRRYAQSLRDKGLPDIPLHTGPLMTGHEGYGGMSISERKRLLSAFRVFFRNLPVRYTCISLKSAEYENKEEVEAAMRRAISNFLFDHLAFFQDFDDVKIYYDNGQGTVAHALHRAMDFALPRDAVVYKAAAPENYRLSQVADYICTMELAALRYRDKNATATDEKFFGGW
ncbi:DUF3800 domain-containing protein [Atopobiaceae bacterium 24-176]